MSTILKALRRLEADKSSHGAQRPLREEVLASFPSRARARRVKRRAAMLLAGAVLAGGLALALLSTRSPILPAVAQPPPAPPQARAAQAPPPVTLEAPGSAAPAVAVEAPTPAPPAATHPAVDARETPELRSAQPEPHEPLVAVVERPPSAPAFVDLDEPEPAPPPPAVARAPKRTRSAAPAAPAARAAAAPQRDYASRFDAPSRASALPLTVTRTVWHPRAERRLAVVTVEGESAPRELREGDSVGMLVVRRIDPSGVVFARGAAERLLRVGEAP